jgi:cytochrome c-type biogenesis protein CcmE
MSVSISAAGVVTGTLVMNSRGYEFRGTVDRNGNIVAVVAANIFGDKAYRILLQVQNAGTPRARLTGTVESDGLKAAATAAVRDNVAIRNARKIQGMQGRYDGVVHRAPLNSQLGGSVRIGGLVEDGSVRRADDGTIHFAVTDLAARVAISYQGILPDLFREGQGIVAQGWLGPDGAFRAREVLAKHDETYMPKEVADALKRAGMWQHAAPPADSPAETPAYMPAYAPAHAPGGENPEGASIP